MVRFVLKTWNCFGAAQSVSAFLRWKGPPDAHRFRLDEVIRTVHDADILCMQEVFLSDAETFFDRLEHPHKRRDLNASRLWPLTFGGSGLGIASRFPILQQEVRAFGRPQVGAERFARKGMLHARMQLSGAPSAADADEQRHTIEVDVITTHMQSGYDADASRVRRRQLTELKSFVQEVGSRDRAFIVCGDLNINGLSRSRAEGEYEALREMFDDFVDIGEHEDWPTFHPHPEINELAHRFESSSPEQRLDYVLFRPSMRRCIRPTERALALREPFTIPQWGRTFASDHFAVRVVFEGEALATETAAPSQSEDAP